jgi:hypothetical protein
MTTVSDYSFYNTDRIGTDSADETQRNISNTRYTSYVLDNYLSTVSSSNHVDFATQMQNVNFRGNAGGVGIPGKIIDYDSMLLIKNDQSRAFEKLQLNQRPFLTVPYLGRGSANPDLESQLFQGESVSDKKSLTTVMDKAYIDYAQYPLMDDVKARVTNPNFSVEESALNGWIRGGIPSRDMSNDSTVSKGVMRT